MNKKIGYFVFSNLSREKIELLTRKSVSPHEYLDLKVKFVENQLLQKEQFYANLNDSHISDEEYAHAQRIWSSFNCQILGEYVDLYLKTDVLYLADIFEIFWEQCLKTYGVDPASRCSDHYAKANNPHMEFYNENEIVYLVYFDANNLYGWAMTQSLSYGGF